jgi:hypothetical protein
MQEQLERLVRDAGRASERVAGLKARLDDAEWTRRPEGGGWSVGECVAHLNLTSEASLPRLREAVESLRAEGRTSPARHRHSLLGWLIWKSQAEGGGMKSKTGAGFVPRGDALAAETVGRFEALQAELLELLRAADGLALGSRKIVSPFNARVRYNVYSALAILVVHQHRHLTQAEAVAAAPAAAGAAGSSAAG